MEISEFNGMIRILNHILRHNITPDEVEEVAFDDDPWIRKGRKGTRYLLGYTIGG